MMRKTTIVGIMSMCALSVFLQACSTTEPKKEESKAPAVQEATAAAKEAPAPVASPAKKEEPKINTSVFRYAKSVDVTDARDITQHVDLVVHMSETVGTGLAVQHVLTQEYDFLQQKDIKGANTVTVGVMSGNMRIAQFTTDVKKFKAGENLIKSVMQASKVDKMNGDVKEYGKAASLW